MLEDTRSILPPYDAFMLVSPQGAQNTVLLNTLEKLEGRISTELMRQANSKVDLDRMSVAEAGSWLYEQLYPGDAD